MALDEKKILAGKFLFVSYSHKDADAVTEDMNALLAKGVRVWYDVNMEVGDNWVSRADEVLHNNNCAGVIFYNSRYSFASQACQKEQDLTREIGLKYWFVNLDCKMTSKILLDAMNYLDGSDTFSNYAQKIYKQQSDMFHEEKLCIMRDKSETVVNRIYNEIAVKYHIVDCEDNFLADFNKKEEVHDQSKELVFGKYVAGEYFGPEQPMDESNQRFGVSNNLIQLNRKCYTTRDLSWKLMYVNDDGNAVLLCTRILRQSKYYDGIDFLKNVFSNVAFSESEKQKYPTIKVRYMNETDVQKCRDSSVLLLLETGKLNHWWIDAVGLTEHWKQTYSNNINYRNGFSCSIKKGIRPVIEISAGKIN